MSKAIENSKDLIMWLLYAKGHKGEECEPILGRTRLVKIIFLFKKEMWKNKDFNLDKVIKASALPKFQAHNYGPFDKQIYEDIDFLADMEFVQRDLNKGPVEEMIELDDWEGNAGWSDSEIVGNEDFIEEKFSLTELGKEFVESNQAGKLTINQKNAIGDFKARCTGVSLNSLLKYVYKEYPKTTKNSKIKKKVLAGK